MGYPHFLGYKVVGFDCLEMGEFSLSCRFKNCEDKFSWVFIGAYNIVLGRYKEVLWEELGRLVCGKTLGVLYGDFNL